MKFQDTFKESRNRDLKSLKKSFQTLKISTGSKYNTILASSSASVECVFSFGSLVFGHINVTENLSEFFENKII